MTDWLKHQRSRDSFGSYRDYMQNHEEVAVTLSNPRRTMKVLLFVSATSNSNYHNYVSFFLDKNRVIGPFFAPTSHKSHRHIIDGKRPARFVWQCDINICAERHVHADPVGHAAAGPPRPCVRPHCSASP